MPTLKSRIGSRKSQQFLKGGIRQDPPPTDSDNEVKDSDLAAGYDSNTSQPPSSIPNAAKMPSKNKGLSSDEDSKEELISRPAKGKGRKHPPFSSSFSSPSSPSDEESEDEDNDDSSNNDMKPAAKNNNGPPKKDPAHRGKDLKNTKKTQKKNIKPKNKKQKTQETPDEKTQSILEKDPAVVHQYPPVGLVPKTKIEPVFRENREKKLPNELVELAKVDTSVDTVEMQALNNEEGFEMAYESGLAPQNMVNAVLNGTSRNPFVVVRQLKDVLDETIRNIPKFQKLCLYTNKNYGTGRKTSSKHLNRIMLLACNNLSLHHRPEGVENSVWEQMQKVLYNFQKLFFGAKEDFVKMKEMIDNCRVGNYIHFIFFQSMWRHDELNFPEKVRIHPLQMKIFSTCSFHYTNHGCNVDWLLTNSCHPANLMPYHPIDNNRTIKGYGFATLHLIMIQEWMQTVQMSDLLYLECDRTESFPYMMYRNLFFTHCDKKTKIPEEILALNAPESNLELLHSTVRVKDVLGPIGVGNHVWTSVFGGAEAILRSHGMPKFCNNGGLDNSAFKKVSDMIEDRQFSHTLYAGVFVQENVKFDSQPFYWDDDKDVSFDGNEKILECAYNSYVHLYKSNVKQARCEWMGNGRSCVWTVEDNIKSSRDDKHLPGYELSSGFLSLSHLIFGDAAYYDRLRLCVAWVCKKLLQVCKEKPDEWKMDATQQTKFLADIEDGNDFRASAAEGFSFEENGDLVTSSETIIEDHLKLHLHLMLTKVVDISNFGFAVISAIYRFNVAFINAKSKNRKWLISDEATSTRGRFWEICLEKLAFEKSSYFNEKYNASYKSNRREMDATFCFSQFTVEKIINKNEKEWDIEVWCPFQYGVPPVHYVTTPNVQTMQFLQKWYLERSNSKTAPKLNVITEELPLEERDFFKSIKIPNVSWDKSQKFFNAAKEEVLNATEDINKTIIRRKAALKVLEEKIRTFTNQRNSKNKWYDLIHSRKQMKMNILLYQKELDFARMSLITNIELLLRDRLVCLEYDQSTRNWTGLLEDSEGGQDDNSDNLRLINLTKGFVYDNFDNRFIQWIKKNSKIETFVDTKKANPFPKKETEITAFGFFRPLKNLNICNVLGYSEEMDQYLELTDHWFNITLLDDEKKRLEDDKEDFMNISADACWEHLGNNSSEENKSFECTHKLTFQKLFQKIKNETSKLAGMSKLDKDRVKKLEENISNIPHTDECYFWRLNSTILRRKILVNLSESQLNQIRYNPDSQEFEGMIHYLVSKKNARKLEVLDRVWVKSNFDEAFLQTVRKKAAVTRKFFKVPPGNPTTSSKVPEELINACLPETVFRQSSNEKRCLLMSFANALHFNGYEREAWTIFNLSLDESQYIVIFSTFRKITRDIFPRHKITKLPATIDKNYLLRNIDEKFKVVALLGNDGDAMHSVTIWNGIIFDSTLDRALPLTAESLDFILGKGVSFIGTDQGYEIDLSTKYFQNKNKKKRKKYFKKQQQKEAGKETKQACIKNKEMNLEANDLNQMEDIVEEDSSSENDMGVL